MPHFRPSPPVNRNTSRDASAALSAAVAIFVTASASAADGFDYPSNLREVYGAYQGVLARREACASAYPQLRPASEKAYTGWQGRHKRLIDELDLRVAMMIRGASKDEKDYARNIGKYEGAILRQREGAAPAASERPRSDVQGAARVPAQRGFRSREGVRG
jgi:hypothetical protein